MAAKHNHALVIGASGLIGWALVNELLSTSPSPFTHVTALVNRPFAIEESFWPLEDVSKISLVSGVDLSSSDEEFERAFKEKVKDVESISHVFYFGMY
jgi:uncharacterized protein YbjT (DUF2867 family)